MDVTKPEKLTRLLGNLGQAAPHALAPSLRSAQNACMRRISKLGDTSKALIGLLVAACLVVAILGWHDQLLVVAAVPVVVLSLVWFLRPL
jgi:hypothetical protein